MDNLDIFKKVLELETVIKAYFEEINKQGIWIFLSCLSAFSAPNMALKILAFVIIGLMLFYTLYKTKAWSLAGSKSFKDTLSVYQKEIENSDIQEEYKYQLKSRLKYLEENYFKFGWRSLVIGLNFYLGMFFLACSLAYLIWN